MSLIKEIYGYAKMRDLTLEELIFGDTAKARETRNSVIAFLAFQRGAQAREISNFLNVSIDHVKKTLRGGQ